MSEYVIMTDSSCDLPEDYIKEHGLDVLSLLYNLEGTIYGADNQLDIKDFYARMRAGSMPTTMAVNPEDVAAAMRKHLAAGKDVLYIAFSSGLSASCQNSIIAANDVKEEFPDRKVFVVDSLCASMGQGLFVHYALKKQAEGLSLEEAELEVAEELSGMAALHNPDQIAGGHSTIISARGDSDVNSALGSLWGHGRAEALYNQVSWMAENMTQEQKDTTYLDVRLNVHPD